MAEKMLDRYCDEIVTLHQQRYTQARMRRHLEVRHGLDIPKATLSRYLKELRDAGLLTVPDAPPVTSEEEHFLEQADVYLKLQQSSVHVVEAIAQLLGRMGMLEETTYKQQEALQRLENAMRQGMQSTQRTIQEAARARGPSDDQESLTLPLQVLTEEPAKQTQAFESLRRQMGTRSAAAAPTAWLRALLITGAFWAGPLVIGSALYFAPWRWFWRWL